jgi:uncharacterized membrane protein
MVAIEVLPLSHARLSAYIQLRMIRNWVKSASMIVGLVKSGTLALLHMAASFGVVYALTGSAALATGIALVLSCVMSFVFALHERAWDAVLRKT